MIDEDKTALANALFDALTLEWSDNGNIMAEAVRDHCIGVLAEELGETFEKVEEMIEQRVAEKQ